MFLNAFKRMSDRLGAVKEGISIVAGLATTSYLTERFPDPNPEKQDIIRQNILDPESCKEALARYDAEKYKTNTKLK